MSPPSLPDLPPAVADLVQSGVYAIYQVGGEDGYLLVTNDGTMYRLSSTGKPLEGKTQGSARDALTLVTLSEEPFQETAFVVEK